MRENTDSGICAHLREIADKDEECEGVRAIRDRERREDRELRADPQYAEANAEGDLEADVRRCAALLVQERQQDEADDAEQPPDIVLRAVDVDDLDADAGDDGEDGDRERETEHFDAGLERACFFRGLQINR